MLHPATMSYIDQTLGTYYLFSAYHLVLNIPEFFVLIPFSPHLKVLSEHTFKTTILSASFLFPPNLGGQEWGIQLSWALPYPLSSAEGMG
jgi:hypothetical protein